MAYWLNDSCLELSVKCSNCGYHHDLTIEEIKTLTAPKLCPNCNELMEDNNYETLA